MYVDSKIQFDRIFPLSVVHVIHVTQIAIVNPFLIFLILFYFLIECTNIIPYCFEIIITLNIKVFDTR